MVALIFAALVGSAVALVSPAVALGFGLALWVGMAANRDHLGLLIAATGFSSGALSGSLIRLSYLAL